MFHIKPSSLYELCAMSVIITVFAASALSQVRAENQSILRLSPELFINGAFRERLKPESKQLLDRVESYFGREVRVTVMNDWDRDLLGESFMDEDGVPEIRLNASTGCTEVCVVHELFHLKLKAEGYPAIIIRGDLTESQKAYYQSAAIEIRETLQHKSFYPEMRRMGLAPAALQRAMLKQTIKDDRNRGLSLAPDEVFLALSYFRACIEVEDPELISQIEKSHEKKQHIWALETGKRLVRLARESRSQTPEEEIALLIRCLDLLFLDKVRFEAQSWFKRSGIENVAVLQIVTR